MGEIGLPIQVAASLSDNPTDAELVEACKRGNLRAFERLYELHAPRMKSLAFHLVGSRALCRLAQILRDCSRSVDNAARHGGDEFALVLPETSADAERSVGWRICELLAKDGNAAKAPTQTPVAMTIGTSARPVKRSELREMRHARHARESAGCLPER